MNTTDTPAIQAHRRHMETLTSLPRTTQQVEEYLADVRKNEGAYRAKLLRDDYFEWKQSKETKR
ncbi:MAG: hypothetical protein KGI52_11670 [Burkholderiales bacterium]|nr:hypothetical protein [Burkholderiales bacterium]